MASTDTSSAAVPTAETYASNTGLNESHKHRQHSKNKKSDPFLELNDGPVKLPEQPSPSNENENEASQSDTLLNLVLTPLNMVSFVLSLFMIDMQQRRWRTSQHAAGDESFWFRLTHPSWLDPEPYQDSRDSTWKNTDKRGSWNTGEDVHHKWYGRKKKRAIAKMEFGAAFELRGRVVVALLAWTLISALTLTYAAKCMYAWVVGN